MGSGRSGTARQSIGRGAVPDPTILEFQFRPQVSGADSVSAGADQEELRAELARRLNASIYKIGRSLADEQDEDVELAFICACGCMAEVKRSLREYVTRGALLTGHSRKVETR
jgi:hypothetical protein